AGRCAQLDERLALPQLGARLVIVAERREGRDDGAQAAPRGGPQDGPLEAGLLHPRGEEPERLRSQADVLLVRPGGGNLGCLAAPVDTKRGASPGLDRRVAAGLVAALESPSGWQRDTAQRLLLHKGDKSAAGPLRELAAKSHRPKTREQALWTLQTLDALTPE